MEDKKINDLIKEKLLQYGFYDDNHKYTVILNENYLKQLFEADVVAFKE